MKSPLLVSVIIPNYNNAQYLGACLESCMTQTYQALEIIVIDDCSTDASVEIIEAYCRRDKRIRLICNIVNQKVSSTRHTGILECKGSWITTLDSDDFYLSPDKIRREVEVLELHRFRKDIIAYSGIVLCDADGTPGRHLMSAETVPEGDLYDSILTRSGVIPRDFLFSKEAYFDAGGFDRELQIFEDWDLKIRLAKRARFFYSGIDDGIGYRLHGHGLSSVTVLKKLRGLFTVFSRYAHWQHYAGLAFSMLQQLLSHR